MTVASIHLHSLPSAWATLWPILAPAHAPDQPDVRRMIESGHAQLWAILDDGQPIGAVVTQIKGDPKTCLLWMIGGSRVREWADTFLAAIEKWARELGCVALWGCGRRGWARIVEPRGFVRVPDVDGRPTWERKIT